MGILDTTIKNHQFIFRSGFVMLILGLLLGLDPQLLSKLPDKTVSDITIIILSIANVLIVLSLIVYVLTHQDEIKAIKTQNQAN